MPVLGVIDIAMLQNCQAASDYLNEWEHGFIESISIQAGDSQKVDLSANDQLEPTACGSGSKRQFGL